VRFFSIDDGIDAGVCQREVVLDDVDLGLPVDPGGGLKVSVGQRLHADSDITTLDIDEQVPSVDGTALKYKNEQ